MSDMKLLKHKYSGWGVPAHELPAPAAAPAPAMTQDALDALVMAKAKELVAAEAAQAKPKKAKALEAAE